MSEKTSQQPVSHVVRENNELRKENYSITKQSSGRLLIIAACSFALNGFLIWLAFFHFPQTEYIPTSNAAAICKVIPVSEPSLTHAEVSNFAVDAAVSMYSFDHVNYKKQANDTADKYFTPDYRNEYMIAFGDSRLLQAVVENFYVVSATTAGRPAQIVKTGQRGGHYFWIVQVPLNVHYTSGRKRQEERLLAEVEVIRTPATRLNPKGIGINGANIKPLMN